MSEVVGAATLWMSNSAGQGTSNGSFQLAEPTTGNFATVTYSESSNTWKQLTTITANSTAATPSDVATNGLNMLAFDLDATSAAPGGLPADRYLKAQSITVQGVVNVGQADVGGTFNLHGRLGILNPSTGVVTPIATADQNGLSASLAAGVQFSFTISVPSPGVRIPAGSTLHLTLWAYARKATLANQTLILRRGTQTLGGSSNIVLPSPGLRYAYSRSASSSSGSSAAGTRRIALATKTASSSAVAAFDRRLTLFRALAASSSATAVFDRQLQLYRSFSASSSAQATRQPFVIALRALAGLATAQAARQPFVITLRVFTATSTPQAVIAKRLFKNLLATSGSAAHYARQLQFKRTLGATSSAIASMLVLLPQSVLNRMTGGAVNVIKRITYIFDD